MSKLILPKHMAGQVASDRQLADMISKTSKHRIDSDDFVTKPDVRDQLEKLTDYVNERHEEDGYELPQPSGWKLMCLALTIPDKVGNVIVIDDAKEARSLATPQGVILAMGPGCYVDPVRFPAGPWHVIGDRISWVKYDATMFQLSNGQRLAFLTDTQPLSRLDGQWIED